jgi:putative transposase
MGGRDHRRAMVAAVGTGAAFSKGRAFAACLGLVPKRFLTLADTREKMDDWRRYYNEVRPHDALGHKPVMLSVNHGGISSLPP